MMHMDPGPALVLDLGRTDEEIREDLLEASGSWRAEREMKAEALADAMAGAGSIQGGELAQPSGEEESAGYIAMLQGLGL